MPRRTSYARWNASPAYNAPLSREAPTMIDHVLVYISALAAVTACTCCAIVLFKTRALERAEVRPTSPEAAINEVAWEPPSPTQPAAGKAAIRGTVEGLEMNLDKGG